MAKKKRRTLDFDEGPDIPNIPSVDTRDSHINDGKTEQRYNEVFPRDNVYLEEDSMGLNNGIGYDEDHESLQAATGEFFSIGGFDQAEQAMKSRRKLKITIVVIIVLVVALVITGYYVLSNRQHERNTDTIVTDPGITGGDIDESTSTDEDYATTVPNLSSLFGLNSNDAANRLGSDYSNEGTSNNDSEDSDIKSFVTFKYSPQDAELEVQTGPELQLGMNEEGAVIQVKMSSSLPMVGIDPTSFESLISTPDTLNSVLESCGISQTVDSDSYSAPSEEEYTVYEDEDATFLVVEMLSASFTGSIDGESAPTKWEITFSYDYSQSDSNPSRTIEITLS